MNKINKHLKKLALASITMLTAMSLTGCGGENLKKFARSTMGTQLNDRFNANATIVSNLQQAGLLEEKAAKDILKNIEKQKSSYLTTDDNGELVCNIEIDDDGKIKKADILSAIAQVKRVDSDDCPSYDTDDDGNDDLEHAVRTDQDTVEDAGDSGSTDVTVGINRAYISNYVLSEASDAVSNYRSNFEDKSEGHWQKRKSGAVAVKPIEIISEDTVKKINEKLSYDVYILKADMSTNGSIDELLNATKDQTKIDPNILAKYFEIAKFKEDVTGCVCGKDHAKGDNVTLRCLIDTGDLVGDSEENTDFSKNKPGLDLVVQQEETVLGSEKFDVLSIRFKEFNEDAVAKLKAVVGSVNDYGKWYLTPEGTSSSGNNGAYLMEYPVNAIAGFQNYSSDDKYVEAVLEKTNLGLNIWSGKMLLYKYDNNELYDKDKAPKYGTSSSLEKSIEISDVDESYLTLRTETSDANSSFYVSGITSMNISDEFTDSGNKIEVETGRIILTDYLEGTYAPSFSKDSGKLVVFGRKIRFNISKTVDEDSENITDLSSTKRGYSDKVDNEYMYKYLANLNTNSNSNGNNNSSGGANGATNGSGTLAPAQTVEWTDTNLDITHIDTPMATLKDTKILFDKGETIASFVNADGVVLNNADGLKVTDFCDFYALSGELNSNSVIVKPNESNMSGNKTDVGTTEGKNASSDLAYGTTDNFVMTAFQFPGSTVGTEDWENDLSLLENNGAVSNQTTHQIFYCMATNSSMFDTGMFSSWINSPDTNASLAWWNTWLESNNYTYSVNEDEVFSYIQDNYKYELSKYGYVLIDLDTIHKIQEEYDTEAEQDDFKLIRTVFRMLGLVLIGMSLVYLLFWVIDTNMDFGVRLLNKATFGAWEAVKYDGDMPTMDSSGVKYITFDKIITSCMILASVGIIINVIDVFDLVLFLIKTLGVIATELGKVLAGAR